MGFRIDRRPTLVVTPGGMERITSTSQTMSNQGVGVVALGGSTADKVVLLARPTQAGVEKTIICETTGTRVVSVRVAGSTTSGFFGNSTFRTITFSSLSTKLRTAKLVSYAGTGNTMKWSVIAKSTGATLAG